MKYKAGDRVKIKSLDWYNKNKSETGFITFNYVNFMPEMSRYCSEILTINRVVEGFEQYLMSECGFAWTDEMIEGLVEEETSIKLTGKAIKNNEMVIGIDEYTLPEGYIFKDENGNIINARKIVLEKKKKEYPKTYEECYCVLLERASVRNMFGYKADLMVALQKLLVCRDAYWKIAGEEMGLGKLWEPDWSNKNELKHCIENSYNKGIHYDVLVHTQKILAFPTAEMRDAFYENFNELIEECKDFL